MTDKPISPPKDPAAAADDNSAPEAARQQPKKRGDAAKTILWERRSGMFGRNPVPRDGTSEG